MLPETTKIGTDVLRWGIAENTTFKVTNQHVNVNDVKFVKTRICLSIVDVNVFGVTLDIEIYVLSDDIDEVLLSSVYTKHANFYQMKYSSMRFIPSNSFCL